MLELFNLFRVKSLSKGNTSKRDITSSTTSKDSNSQPFSSGPGQQLNVEEITTDSLNGSSRFGWSRELEREASASPKIERVPSGRADSAAVSGYTDYYRGQNGGLIDMTVDDDDTSADVYEQEKRYRIKNKKPETFHVLAAENRTRKEHTDFYLNNMNSDDDLNTLLKVRKLFYYYRRVVHGLMHIILSYVTCW